MIFTTPMPFDEALNSRKVKAVLPTELGSRDLQALSSQVKERASFSAKVTRAEILDRFDQLTTDLVQPRRVDRGGVTVTEGLTLPYAREAMRNFLKSIGYQAEAGKEGSIEDLTSTRRLDVKFQTDLRVAQGFGYDQQGQSEGILDQWPAQELYRAISTNKQRDWGERWVQAANAAGDDDALRVFESSGRMIARKDSTIWDVIGSPDLFPDGLGNPYPPFAFNSGMDVRDVDRKTAVAIGLIRDEDVISPRERLLNDELKVSPEIRSENLRTLLLQQLGDNYEFDGDVLRRAA
jgi:hypothetical protein